MKLQEFQKLNQEIQNIKASLGRLEKVIEGEEVKFNEEEIKK